ncbi:MAG: xenobiotic reductase B [Bacteroidaceae bacterium]|nr:xenobiotic reductase B [Bacteroidaceae bacterium]
MCTYKDLETIELSNGKTVGEVNEAMRREIEKIYVESWQKGISVPFFDNEGNIYLANPDGSEDRVSLDRKTRTYRVLHRTAQPGKGRYSHLIAR